MIHKAVEEGNTTDGLKKDISLQVITKDPFTPIPPPNVTGSLHIGHAWDNTRRYYCRCAACSGLCCFLPGMTA